MTTVDAELKAMERDLHRIKRPAYAAGTAKNVLTQWKAFMTFLSVFSLVPIPAQLETL